MKSANIPDERNPDHIFSLTDTTLLLNAVNGTIDLLQLAKNELAARGLNDTGTWVGFEAAKKIWNK